jgi:hypothetical protein
LGWYWALQTSHDQHTDAELYLDSFSKAVRVPTDTLREDLSRAQAVLQNHKQNQKQGYKQDQKQEQGGYSRVFDRENDNIKGNSRSRSSSEEQARHEKSLRWATYYVQLMKEAKMCFVFDQLSHGNDRMRVSDKQCYAPPAIMIIIANVDLM